MLRCCPRCPHREVIAVDLPGFGETAPLTGEVTRHTLTDAVQDFIKAEGAGRCRRGRQFHGRQNGSGDGPPRSRRLRHRAGSRRLRERRSAEAVQRLHQGLGGSCPQHPTNAAGDHPEPGGRTLLARVLGQLWKVPADLVVAELRGSRPPRTSTGLFRPSSTAPDGRALPPVRSKPRSYRLGSTGQGHATRARSKLATGLFPDATRQCFDRCRHFPRWDRPGQAADLILSSTRSRRGAAAESSTSPPPARCRLRLHRHRHPPRPSEGS